MTGENDRLSTNYQLNVIRGINPGGYAGISVYVWFFPNRPKMPLIYSYLRVSTDDQDVEKYRMLVLDYANRIGVGPVHFESEKVSGKINWQKRKVAGLIAQLQPGDLLIEPEMYRIGRSTLEIHVMADQLRQRGAHAAQAGERCQQSLMCGLG